MCDSKASGSRCTGETTYKVSGVPGRMCANCATLALPALYDRLTDPPDIDHMTVRIVPTLGRKWDTTGQSRR